ncbi:glycosyltransferase family 2 protein [Flavobacterium reichenbachii]|uniref:Glycosyl transferase n=1 Tax=Flavobacterium reichenbachii TaxID=362418 RepID=A0A085ZP02_9FLAO|nr:glycosyltransferase family A protein [Flavobacterium reichenbachii]KFF06166.1 glycosyl transferase [Flavobacterium reichenbachii]OXB17613.1 glycosyl transferase [Flavobacterium reichenbachii]
MLSILIPVYNYNVFTLVETLYNQCLESDISFEIICLDDASNEFLTKNQQLNQLNNVSFSSLKNNVGRSNIRNLLVQKASYENVLFLDADTIPVHYDFISKYIQELQKGTTIAYGGILYKDIKPPKEQLLRWIYGRKREALKVDDRIKNPAQSAFVSNLLIKKEIAVRFPFDETIIKYGFEDMLFFSVLKSGKIPITHLENPVYHLNLETGAVFLNKTKTALENLSFLYDSKKITKDNSKIIALFVRLKTLKLTTAFAFLFKKTASRIEQNLLSEKPSLLLFDLYKLGFYCSLKTK